MKFKATRIDITPDFPCRLTGMKTDERQQGIHSRLEMNSIVFSEGGKHAVLISIDTLFISQEVMSHALKQVQLAFEGIKEEELILVATHTHFAPSLEMKRVGLGECDLEYLNFLNEKIEVLINQLASQVYHDVEVEVGSWKTNQLTCNRRRYVRSLSSYLRPFVSMEPNLKGFKNEEFKIIKVFDARDADKILCVLWSFPCHPTNFINSKLLSAEFPGEIRKLVREIQKDGNIPVFYFPGFAGDVRAFPPKRFSISKILRTAFQMPYPVGYYRFVNLEEYNLWIDAVKIGFKKAWDRTKKEFDLSTTELKTYLVKKDLRRFGIYSEVVQELIFRKINLGNGIGIYTISAEPVSGYTVVLDKIATESFFIGTGYSDVVFGYLPTNKQVIEGGYESKGHFKNFLISGDFGLSIENEVESCLNQLFLKSFINH